MKKSKDMNMDDITNKKVAVDLDGDGKMSSYEANRQEAIEKAMAKKGSSNRMDHK